MGQNQEAIEWYDKTLAINPQFVECLYNKGVCYKISVNMHKQLNVITKLWPLILNLQVLQMAKHNLF